MYVKVKFFVCSFGLRLNFSPFRSMRLSEGGSLWVMQIKPFWSGKSEDRDVFTLGLLVQMAGVQFSWRASKKTGMFRGNQRA